MWKCGIRTTAWLFCSECTLQCSITRVKVCGESFISQKRVHNFDPTAPHTVVKKQKEVSLTKTQVAA